MLRKELEVKEKNKIEKIIQQCTTCRIAMISDQKPYIIPMIFGYDWTGDNLWLYFHCGLRGKKNIALRENPYICFEMDVEGKLMGIGGPAHKHSRAFSAIIGEGTIEFAQNNDEKRNGFDYIMKHQTNKSEWEYPDAYLATAEVIRVCVTSLRASHKE